MFRYLRKSTVPAIAKSRSDTILGAGATLKGTLESEGNIRIDGTFEGDVTTTGHVVLGENGTIEGNIKGDTITIAGTARGDLEASHITITRSGRIWGDLSTDALSTQEGGFIQGTITMRQATVKAKSDKKASEPAKLSPELEAQVAEVVQKRK